MEDAIQVRRWNPNARIPNHELKPDFLGRLRFDSNTDGDFTAFGELDPVLSEIEKDLPEAHLVAEQAIRDFRRDMTREGDSFFRAPARPKPAWPGLE